MENNLSNPDHLSPPIDIIIALSLGNVVNLVADLMSMYLQSPHRLPTHPNNIEEITVEQVIGTPNETNMLKRRLSMFRWYAHEITTFLLIENVYLTPAPSKCCFAVPRCRYLYRVPSP